MNEQIHARGAHVTLLNPHWDWANRGNVDDENGGPTPPPEGPQLIDSWDISNMAPESIASISGGNRGVGQIVSLPAGVDGKLHSIKFHCEVLPSTPDQPVHVRLYSWVDGYGPSGGPLATADAVNMSNLPAVGDWFEFLFSDANRFQLQSRTDYLFAVAVDTPTGNSSLGIKFGSSLGVGGYTRGNHAYTADGVNWTEFGTADMIFELYAEP